MENTDYERVAEAIRFIQESTQAEPKLEEIASQVGLSPFHFERLFKRWAGTTPKRFIQCLRLEHAKTLLRDSQSVLDASLETGLSSPSRLHDLFCTLDAVTPGEFKSGGEGLEIAYGVHATPFGPCLVAATERGICKLAFADTAPEDEIDALAQAWPSSDLVRDDEHTAELIERIFSRDASQTDQPFHLLTKGTNFQVQVWRALLEIPHGSVVSYRDVAASIGKPRSVRAVAGAVAANPIAYLIPCHRVLRASGAISGYRWGPERKRALLAWEAVGSSYGSTSEAAGLH